MLAALLPNILSGAYDSIIDLSFSRVCQCSLKQASSFHLTHGRADQLCRMAEGYQVARCTGGT